MEKEGGYMNRPPLLNGSQKGHHLWFPRIIVCRSSKQGWPVHVSSFFLHSARHFRSWISPKQAGCLLWCQLKFLARYARCFTRCSSNLSGLARNRIKISKWTNKEHKIFVNPVRRKQQPTSGGYQSRKEYHYNSPSPKSPANYPFTT